eukprot:6556913-Pyramimonas_sp.AAC.1
MPSPLMRLAVLECSLQARRAELYRAISRLYLGTNPELDAAFDNQVTTPSIRSYYFASRVLLCQQRQGCSQHPEFPFPFSNLFTLCPVPHSLPLLSPLSPTANNIGYKKSGQQWRRRQSRFRKRSHSQLVRTSSTRSPRCIVALFPETLKRRHLRVQERRPMWGRHYIFYHEGRPLT